MSSSSTTRMRGLATGGSVGASGSIRDMGSPMTLRGGRESVGSGVAWLERRNIRISFPASFHSTDRVPAKIRARPLPLVARSGSSAKASASASRSSAERQLKPGPVSRMQTVRSMGSFGSDWTSTSTPTSGPTRP